MRILLTGGRLAETLHLSRLLHQIGADVIVADSVPYNLTSLSCSIRKSYFIPPAKNEPMRFAYSLLDIIRKEAVSLLIPTCEELYTVLRFESLLRPHVELFAPTFKNSLSVLSPFRFYEWMKSLNLPVLPVYRFTSIPNIMSDMQKYKDTREYSPEWLSYPIVQHKDNPSNIICTPKNPWIGRESALREQWKSYTWIEQGEIRLHVTYSAPSIDTEQSKEEIKQWIESFANQTSYTGQFSSTFVRYNDTLVAHTCTPEISEGIYWLTNCSSEKKAIHATSEITKKLKETSTSSSFFIIDPVPTFCSFLQHSVIAYRSLRRGISIQQGTKFDIEWGAER